MRINRDTLLKIAQDTVTQRTRKDRGILSAYLCGALLGDDYLLGGTADIDLVFIHLDRVDDKREIVRLTDEVHLDIAHHYQKDYQQTRSLRLHPWLGPTLCECKTLYDPQHFLDFIQASVRGQFYRSDHVLERARQSADHARQIWQAFSLNLPDPGPKELSLYLRAVEHATNAVVRLNGFPLTDRRLLLQFPQRAEQVKRPGLQAALLGMLGGPKADKETLQAWIPLWTETYTTASPLDGAQSMGRTNPLRLNYYQKAFQAILQREQGQAVLWPLLRTWTDAALLLPEEAPERASWREAGLHLGLLGPAFGERVAALDAYLDQIDETLENWARENGAAY
jgi:hypothetical protein